MPRPGRTKITSFPPQTPAVIPTIPIIPTIPTVTAGTPSTLPPMPLALQPQNAGLPPELVAEEPITFPEDMTIDDLIETRRNVGKNSPYYWAAFDEIQRKRDFLFQAHLNSQLKAMQDLTIAIYTAAKLKVPDTVGKPFPGT